MGFAALFPSYITKHAVPNGNLRRRAVSLSFPVEQVVFYLVPTLCTILLVPTLCVGMHTNLI